jgi:hypothetical protein
MRQVNVRCDTCVKRGVVCMRVKDKSELEVTESSRQMCGCG